MIKQQLLDAYPVKIRDELTYSLHNAYRIAGQEKKLFGSFSDRAGAYLRHFWSDAMLEQAVKKLGVDYRIEWNKAGNTPHLSIRSNNWQLTPHSLGTRKAPANAAYRQHLSKTNDLFSDHENESFANCFSNGYAQLLHSGGGLLSAVSLSVPSSSSSGIIYSESLSIDIDIATNPEEIIHDELFDKMRIRVEEQLKRSNE